TAAARFSARASELRFDLTVGARLRRELLERFVEEALRVLVSTLAASNTPEVRDHLTLERVVAELPEEGEGLLEVLNRDRDGSGMNERQSQVVQRQGLGAAVAELTHDRERRPMLLGCLLGVALAPQLRSELVESAGLALRVDLGSFSRA